MLYNYEKKAKIWKITLYSCLQAISSGPLFKDDPPKYSEIQHWKQFWVVAEFKIDIEPTEKRRSFQGQTWAWNICDKYSPVTFIDQHCQISAVLGEIKRYFDWHIKKLLFCVLQKSNSSLPPSFPPMAKVLHQLVVLIHSKKRFNHPTFHI